MKGQMDRGNCTIRRSSYNVLLPILRQPYGHGGSTTFQTMPKFARLNLHVQSYINQHGHECLDSVAANDLP